MNHNKICDTIMNVAGILAAAAMIGVIWRVCVIIWGLL